MKTKKLSKKTDQIQLRELILKGIQKSKKNRYWSAKGLARRYGVHLEHMEHYLVELAQKGSILIGTDPENQLWVGAKE